MTPRRAELLVVSDCFVTPALARALATRVAEALQEGTTVVVVDPQRSTREDFLKELRRQEVPRTHFEDVCDGAVWAGVTPGAGLLYAFGTDEGTPVYYEI